MADPFDYLSSRDDADELIGDFGGAAALRRIVFSGSETEPIQTPRDYATLAVKVDFTWKQIQGGNVHANDERWLVAAGPLAELGITSIAAPDALYVGGVARPILFGNTLQPADTVVLFDCHIRY